MQNTVEIFLAKETTPTPHGILGPSGNRNPRTEMNIYARAAPRNDLLLPVQDDQIALDSNNLARHAV